MPADWPAATKPTNYSSHADRKSLPVRIEAYKRLQLGFHPAPTDLPDAPIADYIYSSPHFLSSTSFLVAGRVCTVIIE